MSALNLEMLKFHSICTVTSSTECYMAIIWKLLDNGDVKAANKQLFTQLCRCMTSTQVVCTVSHQQQFFSGTVLIWMTKLLEFKTIYLKCMITACMSGKFVYQKCCKLLCGFQGKLPPTSFACDPDPGDSSNNNKKTLTRKTSNQYSEGKFCYPFYDYCL